MSSAPNDEVVGPFDPRWDFETLVLSLNEEHRPGSLTSGKTRNVLVHAWGLFVGRARALADLRATIKRHGSRARLGKHLHVTPAILSEYEDSFASAPETGLFLVDARSLRAQFDGLSHQNQRTFLIFAAELLRDQAALQKLSTSSALGQLPSLLGPALRALDLRLATEELARNLDTGVTDEASYQAWCESHSWAFGNAYVARDDIRRLDASNIVDLLLPTIVGFRDVVELKRPDERVMCWDPSHKTYYFSAACSRAVAQVHKYLDRLHEIARDGLDANPQIIAYHPRATIVIGRSADWNETQTRALRGLNERLHGVDVITYDHLLGRARQLLANLTP